MEFVKSGGQVSCPQVKQMEFGILSFSRESAEFLLAVSNSQQKYPYMGSDNFKVSIDRLTIVAELSTEAFESALRREI